MKVNYGLHKNNGGKLCASICIMKVNFGLHPNNEGKLVFTPIVKVNYDLPHNEG